MLHFDPAKTAGGAAGKWQGGFGTELYPRTYTLADIDATYRAEQGEQPERSNTL
jgi:hypothetical protein